MQHHNQKDMPWLGTLIRRSLAPDVGNALTPDKAGQRDGVMAPVRQRALLPLCMLGSPAFSSSESSLLTLPAEPAQAFLARQAGGAGTLPASMSSALCARDDPHQVCRFGALSWQLRQAGLVQLSYLCWTLFRHPAPPEQPLKSHNQVMTPGADRAC